MIYENDNLYIERELSQIPWLKIFTKTPYKELSYCSRALRLELFDMIIFCEEMLIKFYNPTKINIASFANYLPRVHIHIMARFDEDEYYPESMWGKAQRGYKDLALPPFEDFVKFFNQNIIHKQFTI